MNPSSMKEVFDSPGYARKEDGPNAQWAMCYETALCKSAAGRPAGYSRRMAARAPGNVPTFSGEEGVVLVNKKATVWAPARKANELKMHSPTMNDTGPGERERFARRDLEAGARGFTSKEAR